MKTHTYVMTKNRLHYHWSTDDTGIKWTLCGLPSWFVNMVECGHVSDVAMCKQCKEFMAEVEKRKWITAQGQTVGLPMFEEYHREQHDWLESVIDQIDM